MATPVTTVPFDGLRSADLVVDAVYQGGTAGTAADDPIGRLLPVGNQGGFRYAGSPAQAAVRLVVLYTSGAEADWPDALDEHTGIFTYFGDNRRPGRELHTTARRGNIILRDAFAGCHGTFRDRQGVPPFLLFAKAGTGGRAVRFRGLLAPGAAALSGDEDLQAIWRSTGGVRFQNYRAHFTVLDEAAVSRTWIDELLAGKPQGAHCPPAWKEWVQGRSYDTMVAPATTMIRDRVSQLPADAAGQQILAVIHTHFTSRPHDFERCAVELWRMLAPATGNADVTRASRDGGRDAVGGYFLGPAADRISIEFALEAKCYASATAAGVGDIARLISRMRYRTFGVFVTTSYLHAQAYREVRSDEHPVAIVSGRDIVDVLRSHGYTTAALVKAWLDAMFPDPGIPGGAHTEV